FHQVGLVEIGPADGVVVPGVLRASAEHNLEVQTLTASEITVRWPGLRPIGDVTAVFEPSAGYLLVEDCVAAHLGTAQARGAELLLDTVVQSWTATPREVRIQTDCGELTAGRLVITAGPWAAQVLNEVKIPLTLRRKSLFWFEAKNCEYDTVAGLPVFLLEVPPTSRPAVGEHTTNSVFYGFPNIDARGVKFA